MASVSRPLGPRVLLLLVGIALGLTGCADSGASHRVGAVATPPAASSHAAPPRVLRHHLVAAATWMRASQGYRLRVRPTLYGRNHAARAAGPTLDEALKAAHPTPLTLSPSIHHSLLDQLRCHAVFAASKRSWDLETWRPDVGYTKTVLAECNP